MSWVGFSCTPPPPSISIPTSGGRRCTTALHDGVARRPRTAVLLARRPLVVHEGWCARHLHVGFLLHEGVVHTGCCARHLHVGLLLHEGWCTRGVVQGVVCKAFARGASLARGVVHECCARLLHIGTPLAQAAVHKRALLHKQWCTSPLHKGPPLAQVWCGAQVCCTRGHLLHRDVARVCCTRAHLLHKGWCSRPLHDDPALALAHHVCFTLLHESLAQELRFLCSVAQAVARGLCTNTL